MSSNSTSRTDIWKWLALLIIAVFSIYVTYPPVAQTDENGVVVKEGKLRFGLDLKGGTSFTLGVDKDKLRETIVAANPAITNEPGAVEKKIAETLKNCDARIIQVVRRRVDGMGMNEPVIQGMKDHRLLVQLPGIDEATRAAAKKSLQSAAFLEFRLTHPNNDRLVNKLMAGVPGGLRARRRGLRPRGELQRSRLPPRLRDAPGGVPYARLALPVHAGEGEGRHVLHGQLREPFPARQGADHRRIPHLGERGA